ncbi:MAG: carbon-nitrogen hydrolase family protein [Chloroflexi bacterium]|nr:carbon-nitrogen hydrolase family protein [Chloroflexota bacterium]
MSRYLGIAGVQMTPVAWDSQATVRKMIDTMEQISRSFPWVDLIVFPELCPTGLVQFVPAERDAWRQTAEPIPGPLSTQLAQAARQAGKWLLPGSLYESDGGQIYNTAIVISPQGEIVAKYRKMFPWYPYEATAAGDSFCVFELPGIGRLGVCICYDMWFPEVARTLAWMGAEVILHPTLTPTSDRALELILSQANAIFNQCYFVDLNGVGPWGGGRSLIVNPEGRVLQSAGDHETILTEILNLDEVHKVREFGSVGLSQVWKQLRDFRGEFPMYRDGIASGEIFRALGDLGFQRHLRPSRGD